MKTIPPPCPEPEFGRKYWRSLDQLAETPEFKQWVEREFPAGASEWTDPVSRRHFVKIMSASFLLAGLGVAATGCRRPEEKILPFSKMPENYIHGVAQHYATAMPARGTAIPLVVRSNDGRPTKIEGNPEHPDSNGSTDRFAQAAILNLYDPDRATRFMKGPGVTSPAAATDFLSDLSKQAQQDGGEGLAFLVERSSSPSRARLQKQISEKMPKARWYAHEAGDADVSRRTASQAFEKSIRPYYKLDAAKVIVSLDCDFIGSEPDAHNNIRRFAAGRQMEKEGDTPNRLYVIESLMTLTGVNADHRLRIPCSAVGQVAAALAAEIAKDVAVPDIGKPAGVDPKWIAECAQDLLKHRGACIVMAGYRQPAVVHLLAHALNAALGNIGKTIVFHEVPDSKEGTLGELAQAIKSKQVKTLVILGANPVYTAPADLDWPNLQKSVGTVVRLGYYEDETFKDCHWHLPAAHFLESWGDALTSDGTLVPIQPLIAPLFGGLTELEVLARIAGANTTNPYEIARETFAAFQPGGNVEEAWKKFLHDGFLPNSAAKAADVKFSPAAVSKLEAPAKAGTPNKDSLEVVFHRDYSVDDGRYNNNGWLQEMPDPITKMVWDNAVLISRKTAEELEVKNGDVVEIGLGSRTIEGPIWIQPGQADYSLGLALGYGRVQSGRVGSGVGFNAYLLRTVAAENCATGAKLRKTGKTYTLACTQDHWSMEGRPIIREAYLDQYHKNPGFAKAMNEPEPVSGAEIKGKMPPEGPQSLYPNPFDKEKLKGLHQWGMSIDLNKCVGCSACVMACQSENNVPIVGKDQVRRGREMHWLRIDRYYSGPPEKRGHFDTFHREEKQQFEKWIDDPQVVTQPMLCQHCESAPCENVCPVNATVHDQEGLNLMVYNRCVGTRYCSNNCPYKVRKFNYFDYNKRGIGKGRHLYWGPLKHRPDDEWDLLKMIKNPDVTVRMRGVMEKCTFCIQRIEGAKIKQKVHARDSNDVIVPTDSFTTACAQACPANAIVFGNINDPKSRVSQLKKNNRDYTVLDFLLTKPRLTYLAKVRNPNPAMPDYQESPLTLQEYKKHSGEDPFEEHGGHKEAVQEGHKS
jgi:molybdopterin-containing oxidoreductase family iron-sulfur binding subunit